MAEQLTSEENVSKSNLTYYYQVRLSAFSEYSDRVWNGFNWFLALHLAILGFFFTQFDKLSLQPFLAKATPVIGIVVEALWTLMGAEDYLSMKKHRKRTKKVERRVNNSLGFKFVPNNRNPKSKLKSKLKSKIFRQTWLLFLFPLLVLFVWIGILVWKSAL